MEKSYLRAKAAWRLSSNILLDNKTIEKADGVVDWRHPPFLSCQLYALTSIITENYRAKTQWINVQFYQKHGSIPGLY
jgi:hypothetical protein